MKKNPHFNATSVKKQDGKELVHFTAPFFSITVHPLWSHAGAFPRGFGSLRARVFACGRRMYALTAFVFLSLIILPL